MVFPELSVNSTSVAQTPETSLLKKAYQAPKDNAVTAKIDVATTSVLFLCFLAFEFSSSISALLSSVSSSSAFVSSAGIISESFWLSSVLFSISDDTIFSLTSWVSPFSSWFSVDTGNSKTEGTYNFGESDDGYDAIIVKYMYNGEVNTITIPYLLKGDTMTLTFNGYDVDLTKVVK